MTVGTYQTQKGELNTILAYQWVPSDDSGILNPSVDLSGVLFSTFQHEGKPANEDPPWSFRQCLSEVQAPREETVVAIAHTLQKPHFP